MGLIGDIAIANLTSGSKIVVEIGVTEPGCLMSLPFAREAEERLSKPDGVTSIDVRLDYSADWSEERLSPVYKEKLAVGRHPKSF